MKAVDLGRRERGARIRTDFVRIADVGVVARRGELLVAVVFVPATESPSCPDAGCAGVGLLHTVEALDRLYGYVRRNRIERIEVDVARSAGLDIAAVIIGLLFPRLAVAVYFGISIVLILPLKDITRLLFSHT